jgi:predicted enzyme related to lactoylglutathione lyase
VTSIDNSPVAIAAVLLFSARPERLVQFYRDQLGGPLAHVALAGVESHWAAELSHVYFSIWSESAGIGDTAVNSHAAVAFYVPNLSVVFESLVNRGVPVDFPPRRTPLGLIARLRDPDGNRFELYQP